MLKILRKITFDSVNAITRLQCNSRFNASSAHRSISAVYNILYMAI